MLAQAGGHRRVVDAHHDRLAHAAVLGQLVHQQAGHLELVDEVALLVGRAGAVGVTVEQQPQVVAAAGQHAQRLVDVGPDGLGVDAAEVRVALLVDLRHPDAAARQQAADPARPGAPHGVHQHVVVGRLEGVEIDGPAQVLLVARVGVVALDEPGRLGVGERPGLDRRRAVARDRRLEDLEDLRPGRRAAGRLDLEPVVGPRVVAGGDDDAGRGAALDDLVARHLGGHGVHGIGDRDVVGQQHLRGRGGEVLAGEAPVVGDDHALGLGPLLDHVARHAVGAAAHVGEREVVGHAGPPAVRAEDDVGRLGRRGGRGGHAGGPPWLWARASRSVTTRSMARRIPEQRGRSVEGPHRSGAGRTVERAGRGPAVAIHEQIGRVQVRDLAGLDDAGPRRPARRARPGGRASCRGRSSPRPSSP